MEHTYKLSKPSTSFNFLVLLCGLLFLSMPSVAQITLTSTSGSSTSASYTTLKGAIDNINNGTHTGAIDIRVHTNTTETAAISLLESGNVSGASYTSLLIRPADTATVVKTISTATTGFTLFTLNGADNVTIDGRPLSVGSSKLLTISNPNNVASSHTVALTNNATSNTFTYCIIDNGAIGTTASSTVRFTTGANNNNNIIKCTISGGNLGIEVAGTNGTGNNNIVITGCLLINQKTTSIRLNTGVGSMTIDSNSCTHSIATSTSGYQFMNIAAIEPTSTVTVTRNKVYDLNTSAANILQGISFTPVTIASGTLIVRNNHISIGSTTLPNTLSQVIRGLQFGGTLQATVIVEHNTFRVGGTHVTANGNPTTLGLFKSNTATGSAFSSRNNIFMNTRTGSANQHVGAFYNTPTTGTNNIDYNVYMGGGVFIAAWLNNLYGTLAAYKTATSTQEQNSSFGLIDFNNTTEATINMVGPNTSSEKLVGTPVGVLTDMYGNARSINRPYKGAYEAPTPIDTFDIQTVIVYTFGKIPIGTDDTVRALVRNRGCLPVTNHPIHYRSKLGGYQGSVNVSLQSGEESIINLLPYTPSILGYDTLIVSGAADQKGHNDTAIWVRENTLNALSYSRPFMAQTGNLGTSPEGEIVAKFYTPVPNFVNQVNVNFTNAGTFSSLPFQVVIYEDSGANAGPKRNPLWVSAVQNTINGVFNLSIPSVQVSGSFYIGVRQTSPNNIGFAFQNENPIRNRTFYFRQGTGFITSAWNDFAVNASNQFRFMIEPRLTINDDLGVSDLFSPALGCINLGNHPVEFQVQNLGLLNQNFGLDTLKLFGKVIKPSGYTIPFGPVNVTSGFLGAGGTLNVTAIPSFNFDSAGTYTFSAWTKFGPDVNGVNDTLPPLTRSVFAANPSPVVQNFNAATFPTTWTTNRFAISNGNGTNNSNSIRVNIFNTTPFTANCYIQSPRISGIQSSTVLRFDYRILNFTGNTAATLINTDSIKILVSTDCGQTFTQAALINGANHLPSTAFKQYSLPLGSYIGNDVMIKIVYDWFGTTNDVNIDMDNIRIVDGANDMGVTSIASPCKSVILGGSNIFPNITLINYGVFDQYNIPVEISITGPVTYSSTGALSFLASGSSSSLSFPSAFNPTTAGTYTLKAWTSLNNDGDPTNDTLTYTFNVTNTSSTTNAGSSIQFGTGSIITVQNSSSLALNSTFSLECWINRSIDNLTRTIISKDSGSIGFFQYKLALNSSHQLEFQMNTTGGFHLLTSNTIVPTGFNHIAATFNGTDFRFYLNGAIILDTILPTSVLIPAGYNINIGNTNQGSANFIGKIDEVRIWNIARTADQIRASMHTQLGVASSSNLVGYYRFDEGVGKNFTTDISGNCNTAIFGSIAPTWTTTDYPLGNPLVATQTVYGSGIYSFAPANLTLNYSGAAGQDTVCIYEFATPVLVLSPITFPGGVTSVEPNYWIIYRYGNLTSTSTDFTFQLGTGHLNSNVNANDIKLFNRTANSTGAWTMANSNATTASFATQTVSFTQTQGIFGNQLTIGANNNPLPVTMLYLNGRSSKLDAVLQWATASERNCKGFAIERSIDGKRFEEVGFVNGSGNTNATVKYSFVDRGVFNGVTAAFYRLKQLDMDGSFTQSDVVVIKQSDVTNESVTVYPNPVKSELNVEIESLKVSKGTLTITDISGKVIVEQPLTIGEGFNKYTLPDVNALKNGIYFVTITENDKNIYNGKVVKSE